MKLDGRGDRAGSSESRQPGPLSTLPPAASGGFKPTRSWSTSPGLHLQLVPEELFRRPFRLDDAHPGAGRSINVIRQASIAARNGNPKIGRRQDRDTRRIWPCALRYPIRLDADGADEVTVSYHTCCYATFFTRNGGDIARHSRGAQPYRLLIWRFRPRRPEADTGDHSSGRQRQKHDDDQGG